MRLKRLMKECEPLYVLYFEDDYDKTALNNRLLQKLFPKLCVAYTQEEVLTQYLEYHDIIYKAYFDLIILNIRTTGHLDMVRKIRKHNVNQKIILMGDFQESSDLQTILELGVNAYVPKPIDYHKSFHVLQSITLSINTIKKREQNLMLLDPLTELPNRNALLSQLEQDEFSTIMIIDIDTIEYINLIYGYEVGSLVLKEFSHFLAIFCQEKYYNLYLVENQTFAIYDTQKSMNFTQFERNFNELLERTRCYKVKVLGMDIDFDTTIGIVMCQSKAFVKANLALAKAKKENNRFFTYHNEFKVEQTIKWRDSINEAILNNQVIPFFQPIFNQHKEIIKYESLMRIRQEIDGKVAYISPDSFLDTAIRTRQYEALSTAMIQQVFEELERNKTVNISLNVSYYDIKEIRLLSIIEHLIEQKNSDICSRLVIEMVETSDIASYEYCSDFVKVAKKAGIRIAIDDFGTGYSNFTHVLDLQPDYLKIDGSLIKNIDKDDHSLVLVKAIVEFSKKLNIKIIAEFVHNKEIFELLKDLGIDEFQGYYLGEPRKDIVE